jgi:predicted DNA-binding antitoxin AbrB/MazE fold protein
MSDLVKAIFEHGAFVPETPCDLPEGTRVLLAIQHVGLIQPPEVSAPEERARILLTLVERMKRNPLPQNAPRFSRDEMHERGGA